MFREKIQLLLVKIETTSGTEAVPSPTVDAHRTVGIPTITVDDLEDGNRDDVENGTLIGVDRSPSAGAFVRFDVTLELCGAGAAYSSTVRPAVDPFLRAGGMSATVDATSGNEAIGYTTLDAGFETATAYAYSAGQLIKAVGCVFTPKLSFTVNKRAYLSGTMTGKLLSAPTSASVPVHSFSSVIPPVLAQRGQSIGSWTSDDADPIILHAAELDLGTVVTDLPAAGALDGLVGWAIVDRKATLGMTIGVPGLSTFNPHTLRRATGSALPTVNFNIGGAVGEYNTIAITTGRWQLKPPTRANRNLISTYQLSGSLAAGAPTTGRELNISFNR